jgi:hypothetical protein
MAMDGEEDTRPRKKRRVEGSADFETAVDDGGGASNDTTVAPSSLISVARGLPRANATTTMTRAFASTPRRTVVLQSATGLYLLRPIDKPSEGVRQYELSISASTHTGSDKPRVDAKPESNAQVIRQDLGGGVAAPMEVDNEDNRDVKATSSAVGDTTSDASNTSLSFADKEKPTPVADHDTAQDPAASITNQQESSSHEKDATKSSIDSANNAVDSAQRPADIQNEDVVMSVADPIAAGESKTTDTVNVTAPPAPDSGIGQ